MISACDKMQNILDKNLKKIFFGLNKRGSSKSFNVRTHFNSRFLLMGLSLNQSNWLHCNKTVDISSSLNSLQSNWLYCNLTGSLQFVACIRIQHCSKIYCLPWNLTDCIAIQLIALHSNSLLCYLTDCIAIYLLKITMYYFV